MTRGEILQNLAQAHADEADALRAQEVAIRQRIEATRAIAEWGGRNAECVDDPDEAGRIRQRVAITRMEIGTLEKEAARYAGEVERALAQARSAALSRDLVDQGERHGFVHQ